MASRTAGATGAALSLKKFTSDSRAKVLTSTRHVRADSTKPIPRTGSPTTRSIGWICKFAFVDGKAALSVNLLGPFRLTKALFGALAASARNGRGAVVINISSDAAVNPYSGWGAYRRRCQRSDLMCYDGPYANHRIKIASTDCPYSCEGTDSAIVSRGGKPWRNRTFVWSPQPKKYGQSCRRGVQTPSSDLASI
jgi:hypothetical protein